MKYFDLYKFAQEFEVRKTADIFAVTFNKAKSCNILDDDNKIASGDKKVVVTKDMMVCKDADGIMWTEEVESFRKRYKKVDDDTKGCWSRYHPTKDAINIAEEKRNGDFLMHEENNPKKTWTVEKSKFDKYYKKAQQESLKYTMDHVDHFEGQDEFYLTAMFPSSGRVVGKMSCALHNNTFYVYDIEVHKDYKRQGIGRSLIARMLEEKPDAKVIPMGVTTEGKPFWKNLHKSKFIR
jgi:GNAT superfamily N-acetyltransferase